MRSSGCTRWCARPQRGPSCAGPRSRRAARSSGGSSPRSGAARSRCCAARSAKTEMPRNLVVLFDGTWNNKRTRTNVIRMRESIRTTGRDDPQQPCFYDEGVGTKWYNRLSGGAFGRGLSENIQEGHAWLSRHHAPGDSIYVFGFSRGAYTARSLAGLIRKCGLLNSVTPQTIAQAYELYRDKAVHPDDPKAADFRARHSRETRVRCIGVWATVG